MTKSVFLHTYDEIISRENLLEAWQEFVVGKRARNDVQEFERHLMTNLLALHEQLASGQYRHAPYNAFTVSDPKTRSIHKACVADRVLHRAIYRILYPSFDRTFITDSFSCRMNKGTHKALERFTVFARKVSQNYCKTAWVLKCDVRKFFASIDQRILVRMLDDRIADKRLVSLLENIVRSFSSGEPGIGLPLGNLTSQLFANVYLNELDQFVKHGLRAKYYIRYADDFVLLSCNRKELQRQLYALNDFLVDELHLFLHPSKVHLRTLVSGVDFLGWVHFSHHRVLRASTKRRMLRAVEAGATDAQLASYGGMLGHGDAYKLAQMLKHDPSLLPLQRKNAPIERRSHLL